MHGPNVEGNPGVGQEFLGRLQNRAVDSITRLAQLPSTIKGGLPINKRNLLLLAVGTGLLALTIASACGSANPQARESSTPTGRLNTAAAGLEPAEPTSPVVRPGEQLQQYLDGYIKKELEPEFIQFDKQLSPVIGTSPVDLEESDPAGLWRRKFPADFTERGFETRARTGRMEPFYEAYQYKADMGEYRQFVAVLDKNGQLISIWAAKPRGQGFELSEAWDRYNGSLVNVVIKAGVSDGQKVSAEDFFAPIIKGGSAIIPVSPSLN